MSKIIRLCYPNCSLLCPKEIEQTNKKESHRCLAYNKILKHGKFYPLIIACRGCKKLSVALNTIYKSRSDE